MGATLGLVSAGVGAAGSLSSLFNKGGNTAPTASSVQPAQNPWLSPGMTESAGSAMGTIPSLNAYNLWPSLLPQASATSQALYNNPGAPGFQAGAGTAAGMGQQAAGNQFNTGGALTGAGLSLIPYASQIMGTAFDPQNDLYNRTLQQTTDQARAASAARGLSMTPYGAGLENQNTRNFNIDWQNNQLGRQVQGAGAAGGLVNTGAGVAGQGAGLQAGAAPLYYQSSMYPYATNQMIGQNQMSALQGQGQFGAQGAQLPQQMIEDWLRYMGAATGTANAATGATNSQLQGNQLNFNQNQTMLGNQQKAGTDLGAALALLGKNPTVQGWGSPSGSTGWGSPSQVFPGYTGTGF